MGRRNIIDQVLENVIGHHQVHRRWAYRQRSCIATKHGQTAITSDFGAIDAVLQGDRPPAQTLENSGVAAARSADVQCQPRPQPTYLLGQQVPTFPVPPVPVLELGQLPYLDALHPTILPDPLRVDDLRDGDASQMPVAAPLVGAATGVVVSGGVLLSHEVPLAVPSALSGLASGFGMGPGVSPML